MSIPVKHEQQAPVRRSVDELRALAEQGELLLRDADADAIAAWAAENFGASLAVACSMQDAVLPHIVSKYAPGVDTLFLETGYHFAETIGTRDAVAHQLPITVVDVLPKQTVSEQDAEYGEKLYERDPATCCRLRKVEPLDEQLTGYDAWVTGVRREEGPTRANTPVVTFDERHQMVKINPLVNWTFDDLMTYSEANNLVVNPLVFDGYPSIGCEPCTRPVAPGEDIRAGRWAGSAKTECGIHQ